MDAVKESSGGARLVRGSAFEYRCNACKRCCQHKLIRVNPYEVLRLARSQAMTTTDFLARYVDRETAFLQLGEGGFCQFLSQEQGCTVHPDRPLVCRLYPLGRHISSEGTETFSTLDPHPQSEGVYGHGEGTVDSYLAQQSAQQYVEATDRLLGLFHELYARMPERVEAGEGVDIDWLDVDQVIERVGGRRPGTAPDEVAADFDQYCSLLAAY